MKPKLTQHRPAKATTVKKDATAAAPMNPNASVLGAAVSREVVAAFALRPESEWPQASPAELALVAATLRTGTAQRRAAMAVELIWECARAKSAAIQFVRGEQLAESLRSSAPPKATARKAPRFMEELYAKLGIRPEDFPMSHDAYLGRLNLRELTLGGRQVAGVNLWNHFFTELVKKETDGFEDYGGPGLENDGPEGLRCRVSLRGWEKRDGEFGVHLASLFCEWRAEHNQAVRIAAGKASFAKRKQGSARGRKTKKGS